MEEQNVIDVTPANKVENIGIGEDKPQVEAGPVIIENYRIENVQSKGKDVGDKLVLIVKHPQIEQMELSAVKHLVADKIKTTGLWVKLDSDGKIPYKSALASLLRYYKVQFISQLKGIKVDTVQGENGYLVVKAY